MFQSSSTASGIWLRQTSSACSPSSASTIWNSSPSRMRRATLRMTLESSTTKQVFIVQPRCVRAQFPFHQTASRRGRRHFDVEHSVDIENHQKLSIEPVDTGRNARQPWIEVRRIWLAGHVVELEDLANTVDQQSVGFAARLHADGHRRSVFVFARAQAKPGA